MLPRAVWAVKRGEGDEARRTSQQPKRLVGRPEAFGSLLDVLDILINFSVEKWRLGRRAAARVDAQASREQRRGSLAVPTLEAVVVEEAAGTPWAGGQGISLPEPLHWV